MGPIPLMWRQSNASAIVGVTPVFEFRPFDFGRLRTFRETERVRSTSGVKANRRETRLMAKSPERPLRYQRVRWFLRLRHFWCSRNDPRKDYRELGERENGGSVTLFSDQPG